MALFNLDITVSRAGSLVEGNIFTSLDIAGDISTWARKIQAEGIFIPDGSGGGEQILPQHILRVKIAVP